MARRSLIERALRRGRELAPEDDAGAELRPTDLPGPVRPAHETALAAMFAALRRGEAPEGADGRPPDPARADRLLAELDRVWQARAR